MKIKEGPLTVKEMLLIQEMKEEYAINNIATLTAIECAVELVKGRVEGVDVDALPFVEEFTSLMTKVLATISPDSTDIPDVFKS